jgi:hypothetical protein
MKIEMGEEENSDQPYRRSLDEIKAMILEIQARNKVGDSEGQPTLMGVLKVDADADDLLFIGEPGFGHYCSTMRCGMNEHILFRASIGDLSMTRKAKRLLRTLLKSQNQM